jgi:hypothetical protein
LDFFLTVAVTLVYKRKEVTNDNRQFIPEGWGDDKPVTTATRQFRKLAAVGTGTNGLPELMATIYF